MILRLALFLSGSLIGAVIGYAMAGIDAEWTEADAADLALEEASMEPYRAALGWNATGEALVPNPAYETDTVGWLVLARAECG